MKNPLKISAVKGRPMLHWVGKDTDYNGKSFNIVESDLPSKKTDYITGEYMLPPPPPRKNYKVAVKIIDMLGEETLVVK